MELSETTRVQLEQISDWTGADPDELVAGLVDQHHKQLAQQVALQQHREQKQLTGSEETTELEDDGSNNV